MSLSSKNNLMDSSTENVTLFAVYINDILKHYENKREDYPELFELAKEYDLSDPFNKIPVQLYNNLCKWIEDNLGKFNLIKIGRSFGEKVYNNLVMQRSISENATPVEIIQALVKVINEIVQDPRGRKLNILNYEKNKIILQGVQTFNGILQLGILDGIVKKSGVFSVNIDYSKSVEKGDKYDEYMITWSLLA